ncbi:SDR family NAD(P)-dependent oxidoreductase [Legionella sp. W05-934-2]|uniref:SDR family NAD(P)-dependent oxidoreductase n=1 Tax=Legionella sp. W05-934-2 TaxID=1198649 RepID=UPI003461EC7F
MGKRIVVIGATSAIAAHCIRLWGRQPDVQELVLVGRDKNKLQALLDDISVRATNLKVVSERLPDFCDEISIGELIQSLSIRPIDMALIAQGTLGEQKQTQTDLTSLRQVIEVNALSVAFFAEAIVTKMIEQGQGTLGIISSVAGDKARKRNYHYGAAKAMVSFISEGLQHRVVGTNVRICLIKPGPTQTPMTTELKGMKLASVSTVATDIVKGMSKGRRVIYTPWKWRYLMFIIRHLPWYIFKKLDI